MSYKCFIGGKLIETTGGNDCTYAEEDIVFNSSKQIKVKGDEKGVSFNPPDSAKPLEVSNVYVKVRIKEPYKGEFGFDWVDVNPETNEIEKIQDVPFSDVEYFYKKGTTTNDLGNIIEKTTDVEGAKTAIKANYPSNRYSKFVDLPYVLMKPNQEITLQLEIVLTGGELKDDYIAITSDEFYEFEIIGGEKEGNKTKKKISPNDKLDFKIKCLKESSNKKYFFDHINASGLSLPVGGFNMMENKVLKLKFRVIALVSSDGSPNDKAKALFKKFKDAGVKDYLNNNSLNQAGYEVEIENFDAMDQADVDDYFYAFDKADWTTKKYFANINKQKPDVDPATGFCRSGSWDSVNNKCAEISVPTDVIVDNTKDLGDTSPKNNEMDNISIEAYHKKLKDKGKSYNDGGFIILSDFESSSKTTGAYSRTSPLEHYILMVFSTNIASKDTYSHEIGHMLGLPHSFFTDKEKESYKIARENILGNGTPQKEGINKIISDAKREAYEYYFMKYSFYSDKKSLIKYLKNFNAFYENKLKTLNYSESAKTNIRKYISTNQIAINKHKDSNDCSYKSYETQCYFLKNDFIAHKEKYKKYLLEVLDQIDSNFMFFKQKSTKNIMDYHNTRVSYTQNQIKIMRNDSKNYMQELCTCCPPNKN